MKIAKPQLSKQIRETRDQEKTITQAQEEIEDILFSNQTLEGICKPQIAFSSFRFENCIFTDCQFTHSRFCDVIFMNCDLSNMQLTGCSFSRVEYIDCKLTGTNFTGSRFSQLLFPRYRRVMPSFPIPGLTMSCSGTPSYEAVHSMSVSWMIPGSIIPICRKQSSIRLI
ncbi:MAG: pentapeptide repeat-containing protein [Tannerellaceae bacterium]|nr:pentapeptide repeat-containing protein [Tannerellaceae bacterium]